MAIAMSLVISSRRSLIFDNVRTSLGTSIASSSRDFHLSVEEKELETMNGEEAQIEKVEKTHDGKKITIKTIFMNERSSRDMS